MIVGLSRLLFGERAYNSSFRVSLLCCVNGHVIRAAEEGIVMNRLRLVAASVVAVIVCTFARCEFCQAQLISSHGFTNAYGTGVGTDANGNPFSGEVFDKPRFENFLFSSSGTASGSIHTNPPISYSESAYGRVAYFGNELLHAGAASATNNAGGMRKVLLGLALPIGVTSRL